HPMPLHTRRVPQSRRLSLNALWCRGHDMDWKAARDVLGVIRVERERRRGLLRDVEEDDYAYDLWMFEHLPFVNELCLTLLVAVWHQVERELVYMAARVVPEGNPIDGLTYATNVVARRGEMRQGVRKFCAALGVTVPDSLETLRLI